MRLLLSLLLLLPLVGRAATGNTNTIGAWIEPKGDAITVVIGGDAATSYGTNVQFYSGFLSTLHTNFNKLNGTNNLTLTVASSGWTSLGATQAVQRTVYGAKLRRMPYPSQITNWVYNVDALGTNIYVRIELSKHIYAGESVTMSTREAWLKGSTNATPIDAALVSGLTVTNLSALTFGLESEPSMNWAHPGQQRWTNSTEYVYLDGGHWSGVAAVKVEAMEGVNTQTVWAAHGSVSPSGRGPRHGLWQAGIPTSTFSNLANVRVDYIVYPMVGTNVFDSRLDRWTGLTPNPSSQTNFWDRFNTFTNICVVALGGSDADGDCTNGLPENVNAAQYFLTVDDAFTHLAATNNLLYGINEAIGTVYVRAGISNIMGGTGGAGNAARSWTILKNYPGEVAQFTNTTGHSDVSDCWKVEADRASGGDLIIDIDASQIPFSGVQRLWLDNVLVDSATSQFITTCNHITLTDLRTTRMAALVPLASTANMSYALLRDVDLSGVNGAVWIYTAIGLTRQGLTNSSFTLINTRQSASGHGAAWAAHVIFTDSALYQCTGLQPINFGAGAPGFAPTNDALHGMWVENIIVEATNSTSSAVLFSSGNTTNVVFRNIVLRGPRNQMFYNETTNWFHVVPRIYNCIFANSGFASDLPAQSSPFYTNNISYLHQVDCSGNVYSQITGLAQHNWPDFSGVNNLMPGSLNGTFPTNIVKFQNMQGWVGAGGVLGNGDYRLLSDNIAFQLTTHQPDAGYDSIGRRRSAVSGPGPWPDGAVRMGGIGF